MHSRPNLESVWGNIGVVVPMVNSQREVEPAAESAKYPPLGNRSVGGDAWYHYGGDFVSALLIERPELGVDHYRECVHEGGGV